MTQSCSQTRLCNTNDFQTKLSFRQRLLYVQASGTNLISTEKVHEAGPRLAFTRVQEVVCPLSTLVIRLTLSDLILVVRKSQVNPSRVDIQLSPKHGAESTHTIRKLISASALSLINYGKSNPAFHLFD